MGPAATGELLDRKSTRLNSSHLVISYAVFCLKKTITQLPDPLYLNGNSSISPAHIHPTCRHQMQALSVRSAPSWPRVCFSFVIFFFFNDTATTEIYTLSLHDALPISEVRFPSPFVGRSSSQRFA